MDLKWLILLLCASLTLVDAVPPAHVVAARILDNVPKEERNEFLRTELQRGHELWRSNETGTDQVLQFRISDDEAVFLYKYYEKYSLITDENVRKIAENVICWGDKCIDISDPGVHPK